MSNTTSINRLVARAKLIDWLEESSLSTHVAEVVVDHLLSAEIVGRRSHGLRLLPGIMRAAKRTTPAGDDVKVEIREEGTLVVRAEGLPGIYALHRAIEELSALYHDGRLVAVANISGFVGTTGCLGLYSHELAGAGLVGVVMATSPAVMAPPGGVRPVLGTNAVSFGTPVAGDAALIGDFASSTMAYGDVALARERGESVPPGALLDQDGHPSTDPAAVVEGSLVPSGGPKGWNWALMVEVLAGTLAPRFSNDNQGEAALIMSFSPCAFGEASAPDATRNLTEAIRSSGTTPQGGVPHVPGLRFAALESPVETLEVDPTTLLKLGAAGGPTL